MEWTAEEIKQHRQVRGWSQEQAATALGVSKRALINWENDHSRPQADGRAALNRGYGTIPAADVVPLHQATNLQIITELTHRLSSTWTGRIDEAVAGMQLLADLARLLPDTAEQPNLPERDLERDLDWPRRTDSRTEPHDGHTSSGG